MRAALPPTKPQVLQTMPKPSPALPRLHRSSSPILLRLAHPIHHSSPASDALPGVSICIFAPPLGEIKCRAPRAPSPGLAGPTPSRVAQQRAQQTLLLSPPASRPALLLPEALASCQLALLSSPLLMQRCVLLEGLKKDIDLSLYMHTFLVCVHVCMIDTFIYIYMETAEGRGAPTFALLV